MQCKFCRRQGHQRNVRECEDFRDFRRRAIDNWNQRIARLIAANNESINDEFSELPEA